MKTSIYIERDLIKVDDNGKTIYYAVTGDTGDNMLNVDYGMMKNEELKNIKMEYLGTVQVEICENLVEENQNS